MGSENLKLRIIDVDFSGINSSLDLHHKLKSTFGFPDFYGNNVNALIDCLTDIRDTGELYEPMCNISLKKDELLGLRAKGFVQLDHYVIKELLFAIEFLNNRLFLHHKIPTVCLIPV